MIPLRTTAVVAAVRAGAPAVVPVSPLVDTVKRVGDSGELLSTVDRSVLRVVRTPQGFAREALAQAVGGQRRWRLRVHYASASTEPARGISGWPWLLTMVRS